MSIKNIFLIVFIFGIFLIIITPPFQSPDERNHFFRAIHISQGNLIGEKYNNRLGGNLPILADSLAEIFEPMVGNYEKKTNFDSIYNCLFWKSETQNLEFKDFNNTAFFSPFGYLHSVFAIKLVQFLGFPPIIWLWFSKIIALMIWLFLIYKSQSYLKDYKVLFLCLAFLPASLAVNISLSPDMLCNGLSFWCICSTLFYINDDKNQISTSFKVLFGLAICLITWMKIVYMPLIFLLLIIPNFYVLNKKYFWILFASNIFIILFWASVSSSLSIRYEDYNINFRDNLTTNQGINHGKQLFFVLSDPFRFLVIIGRTIIDYLPSTLVHYVGKFGYEKNYLSLPILALLWSVIILQLSKKNTILRKNRLYFLSISLVIIIVFSVTMYMLWTPVGESTIWNFGGKYFIPVFPLIFLGVSGIISIPKKYDLWVDKYSFICIFISNFALVFAILSRYYV